jgi:hypothetical protein
MTNFDVGMKIWWKAILLNALFTGTWAVFEAGTGVVAVIIIMIILGYLITLPLLPLVMWIVKLMRALPYGRKESLCWLNTMLVILVWAFYGLATLVLQSWPPDETFFYLVATTTSLAVLAAVQMTKKHILNLSATSSAEGLAQNKSLTYV